MNRIDWYSVAGSAIVGVSAGAMFVFISHLVVMFLRVVSW